MSLRSQYSILTMAVLMCLFAAAALAQGTTSRVTGTVVDSNGAAVAGATVSLINPLTNSTLTAVTGNNGAYTFDLIPAG